MSGCVILVGAGPGDKGLLTIRGAQALEQAEVVVYDRLVSPEILAMMPPLAEQINVGKASSNHTLPQDDINLLLVEKAQEGKAVVRLKGGDCYLFGRGGEEVETLVAAGVPFEVVPGVTSALSVPAYAGIPVTHRDFCSSVHIVTAHAKTGGKLQIDFDSLVKIGGTLVFLMGVTALPFIMDGLKAAGMPLDMPAAVIESGTRFNQRKLIADISTLSGRAVEMELKSPATIIVGRVCTLSDSLDWFTSLPLHGKTIVVTRPKIRMGTLADKLRKLGAGVVEYPCIETVETPEVNLPKNLSAYAWVVLTSPAGVPAMLHTLEAAGRDIRALYGCKFACIGQGTARELQKYGIHVDYVPDIFDATHLAAGLLNTVSKGERLLLLRAEQGTPELTDILSSGGLSYDEVAIYRTQYQNHNAQQLVHDLATGEMHAVTFTSASTVRGFMESTPGVDVTKFTAVCIGQSTAKQARKYGMHVKIAENATIDAMVDLIVRGL